MKGGAVTIPTLSLWQPWAGLIIKGLKTIETRNEPAPEQLIGRRIAIHASQTDSRIQVYRWLENHYPEALETLLAGATPGELPRGVVLGTARLIETRPTDWRDWPRTMSPVEGFWGWVFAEPRALASPLALEASGRLFEAEIEIDEH